MSREYKHKNLPSYPGILTLTEVAERLEMTKEWISQLLERHKEIQCYRVGKMVIVIEEKDYPALEKKYKK